MIERLRSGESQIAHHHITNCEVRHPTQVGFGLFAGLLLMPMFAVGTSLKVGDRAPDFSLPDQNDQIVKLGDLLGKKNVVLAFYLRAATPG